METTLSLTFQDMILRVAEFLGIVAQAADGTAAIPTDAADLELCKRIVNDGYRRFMTSDVANKHKWQWMQPLISITFDPTGVTCVNNEAYRYYAPDGFFGHLLAPWTYDTTGRRVIGITSEARIRELRALTGTSGDPNLAAHRPIREAVMPSQKTRRWEIIFYPTPSAVFTVSARAKLLPLKLVELTDKAIAGPQHDEAVLAASLYEAEIQRDSNTNGSQANRWRDALARSISTDREAIPKRLGDYGPKEGNPDGRPSSYFQVDSYNGVTV